MLVIEGEQDAIILPETRKALIDDLRRHLEKPITHWIIKDGGHTLMNHELIGKVCDWLEKKNA